MGIKVVIIGAGPGGYVAALRAAQMDAEVTLVEKEEVGGTCLHWGCIPTKVMKYAAEIMESIRGAAQWGIQISETTPTDLLDLQKKKGQVVDIQTKGILQLLKRYGIRLEYGYGIIEGSNRVAVRKKDGKALELSWDRLILAPGSAPLEIAALPIDGENILTSSHALSLEEIPASLLIVGGGVIGCEFASIFQALGSQVSIVETLSRLLPLPSVDEEISATLLREMKKHKVTCLLETTVESVEPKGNKLRVGMREASGSQGKENQPKRRRELEVDKVLVCVGRQPQGDTLGLASAGIVLDQKGWITVDEYLQTNVAGIYAIGDALGPKARPMLAHVASHEGLVAAENALGKGKAMDYRAVPSAIFTMPEIGSVGWTETQARQTGHHIRVDKVLFRNIGKSHVIGEIAGLVKLVSDQKTGQIMGVHIIGPHATELLGEATLAVKSGCTAKDLAETIHAHPTLSEIMGEVALKAIGKPIHG